MTRLFSLTAVATALWLVSCGSERKVPAPEPAPPKAEFVKPLNQSHRFPKANLVKTEVVDRELMGKSFMPGGTLGHYRKGKTEYQMFVAQFPSATGAAIVLPDWRKALAGSKLVPSFGGYFGTDNGRPVFVFSKGAWIAGIAGLPEKEADLQARALAGELD